MLAQKFFKLFPPPKFLNIPYAGLDISDDAVRCIEYSRKGTALVLHRYGTRLLPPGVIEKGEIRNAAVVQEAISSLCKELRIHMVKASLPEEKTYLFKTEVPSTDEKEIRQNIEFKLEQNVPLSPEESIFFFEVIPGVVHTDGGTPVSVSVAPLMLALSYLDIIKSAGVGVISFEVQAKAIARALIPRDSQATEMIVYIMENKTAICIASGGTICFTSTIPWGNKTIEYSGNPLRSFDELKKQLEQVSSYWAEHGQGAVTRVVFAGRAALTDGLLAECTPTFMGQKGEKIRFEIGKVWQNAFSYDTTIPQISFEDSLDYAVAAGLALPYFPH